MIISISAAKENLAIMTLAAIHNVFLFLIIVIRRTIQITVSNPAFRGAPSSFNSLLEIEVTITRVIHSDLIVKFTSYKNAVNYLKQVL